MGFLCKYICFYVPFSIKKWHLFPTFPEVGSKLENVFEIQVYVLKKKILFEVHERPAKQGDVGTVRYALTTGGTKEAKHRCSAWGPARSQTILDDLGSAGFSWPLI